MHQRPPSRPPIESPLLRCNEEHARELSPFTHSPVPNASVRSVHSIHHHRRRARGWIRRPLLPILDFPLRTVEEAVSCENQDQGRHCRGNGCNTLRALASVERREIGDTVGQSLWRARDTIGQYGRARGRGADIVQDVCISCPKRVMRRSG
ncbi:hypothetical protein MPH_10552 [Macrophomina phaseolina MS6]|uniref:Uncharacterized protein n=1 Tax=Macrophomina phaseolina (strain MS6) TaxID=1126212 RepID=K2S6I6_MACPH|nr:hypothetical protein MPH_10552 [Macrophomina phaseolina MS6]